MRSGLQMLCFELAVVSQRCSHKPFSPLSWRFSSSRGSVLSVTPPPACRCTEPNHALRTISSWEPECSVPQTWFFLALWLRCNTSFLIFLGIIPFNPSGVASAVDARAAVLEKGKAGRGVKLAWGQ